MTSTPEARSTSETPGSLEGPKNPEIPKAPQVPQDPQGTCSRQEPRSHQASQGSRDFRPDVQGLRAIAVLLVVVYHVFPSVLPGGYAGVDVFFVISGYLITSQLVREVAKSGHLSLTKFYLKRVRRLLPLR